MSYSYQMNSMAFMQHQRASQQTPDNQLITLSLCWPTIHDVGPTLAQQPALALSCALRTQQTRDVDPVPV